MNWKKMKISYFKKNFPRDFAIPKELISLFGYQEERAELTRGRIYSGHFYLYDQFWNIPKGVDFTDPRISDYFLPFGFDADGSIYAFWKYENLTCENVPVTFLGSTWGGNTILANSLPQFFQLLSLGVDHLGYAVHFPPEWVQHKSNSKETQLFRTWLKEELDIKMPEFPLEIVKQAKFTHPDFNKWIEEKTGIPPDMMKKAPW